MKKYLINSLYLLLIFKYMKADQNKTSPSIKSKNSTIIKQDIKSKTKHTDKAININPSNITLNDLKIKKHFNETHSSKNNLNIIKNTSYNKNSINELNTNSSLTKSNKINLTEPIYTFDDINQLKEVKYIIIQNTHEDQLAESIFYFLSFVLIIFIILFLYKFYKCFCQTTIKEFGEEKNPNNDPELKRISTHDDDNILDETEN